MVMLIVIVMEKYGQGSIWLSSVRVCKARCIYDGCIHQILRGGSYSLSKVTIVNRSRDRAQRLVDRIKSSSDIVNVDGVDGLDDDYDRKGGDGGDNISELD